MKRFAIFLLMSAMLTGCALLRYGPTEEQFAAADQRIEQLLSLHERATKAGLDGAIVADIEKALHETQDWVRSAREAQPTNWLDLGLVALGILTGGGFLGAKAAGAAKWIHMGRSVVKGIDAYKKDILGPKGCGELEDILRAHMTQKDKDTVKEARA